MNLMTPISHRLFAAAVADKRAIQKSGPAPAKAPVIEVGRRGVVCILAGAARPAPIMPPARWVAGARVGS